MTEITAGHPLLDSYYAILTGGGAAYRDGVDLLPLLSQDFVFKGPIAGRMPGAARFVGGVRGFVETVQQITLIQSVTADDQAAVLYDASLPAGVVRFAEFFRFSEATISELQIHFNGPDYLAKGGR
jgi:hypothetical protein